MNKSEVSHKASCNKIPGFVLTLKTTPDVRIIYGTAVGPLLKDTKEGIMDRHRFGALGISILLPRNF